MSKRKSDSSPDDTLAVSVVEKFRSVQLPEVPPQGVTGYFQSMLMQRKDDQTSAIEHHTAIYNNSVKLKSETEKAMSNAHIQYKAKSAEVVANEKKAKKSKEESDEKHSMFLAAQNTYNDLRDKHQDTLRNGWKPGVTVKTAKSTVEKMDADEHRVEEDVKDAEEQYKQAVKVADTDGENLRKRKSEQCAASTEFDNKTTEYAVATEKVQTAVTKLFPLMLRQVVREHEEREQKYILEYTKAAKALEDEQCMLNKRIEDSKRMYKEGREALNTEVVAKCMEYFEMAAGHGVRELAGYTADDVKKAGEDGRPGRKPRS